MSRTIKINFCDMYAGFDLETSMLVQWVRDSFPCEISDHPDFLFVGPYGHTHLRHNCVKILYTGENNVPDFNIFDYAIGFDHMVFGDRYLRLPLYALRVAYQNFRQGETPSAEDLLNRGFCSYVVSNGTGDPIRTKFFTELCKYKPVASGGRYMNNVGGPVADKMNFISKYKFSITFENSASPGYTTEKIMEPLAVWSVPIYWGNPDVDLDFSPRTFVSVQSESDITSAIERIIQLDRDDEAYLKMCCDNPVVWGDPTTCRTRFVAFLERIFSQSKDDARRLISFGYQEAHYRSVYRKAMTRYDAIEKCINVARKMKRAWRFGR